MMIWDALHDLIPFVQFEKREKHPWRCVTFSKVAGICRNASHMRYSYSYSLPERQKI